MLSAQDRSGWTMKKARYDLRALCCPSSGRVGNGDQRRNMPPIMPPTTPPMKAPGLGPPPPPPPAAAAPLRWLPLLLLGRTESSPELVCVVATISASIALCCSLLRKPLLG